MLSVGFEPRNSLLLNVLCNMNNVCYLWNGEQNLNSVIDAIALIFTTQS